MGRRSVFASTFVFVTLAAVAPAAVAAAGALSCAATAAANLLQLPKPGILYPGNGSFIYKDRLPSLKDTRFDLMLTEMRILGEAPGSTASTASHCLGLMDIQKFDIYDPFLAGFLNQATSFDPSLAVGILHVERECWEAKGTNCTHSAWLRTDVLAVPPIARTPDYPSFWAWFREPLLAVSAAWVRGLSVSCEEHRGNVHFAWFGGLANSSLRALHFEGLRLNKDAAPVRAFGDMPLLRSVELINCNLLSLSPPNASAHDCFAGSEHVERVVLSGNWLTRLPECLSVLRELRTLHVLRNDENPTGAFAMDPADLAPLTQLRELRLEDCDLRELTAPLPPLPSLATLSLRGSRLTAFPADAFRQLPQLKVLDLSDNFLHLAPAALLLGTSSLVLFDAHNASLAQWPQLQNVHLRTFNLSLNELSSLRNMGNSAVTVDYLDLSGNQIMSWDDASAFSLPKGAGAWVSRVNLSHNRIAAVDEAMGSALDALTSVDLGANELYCDDCRTPVTQRWLNATRAIVLALGRRAPLLCKDPLRFRGIPLTQVLFDETTCQSARRRLLLGVGVPLLVCLCLAVAVAGASYYYRLEIIYLMHLAKVRQNAKRSSPDDRHCIYDAFVSYSGKNRKWVMRELVPSLERGPERFRLCLHDRDFRLGAHIVDSIVDSIERSRRVLVVLTPHFVASAWCQWELDMAQHRVLSEARRDLLVLLRLGAWGEAEDEEETALPPLLRFLLATRGAVEWPAPASRRQARRAARLLRRALAPSLFQSGQQPGPAHTDEHDALVDTNSCDPPAAAPSCAQRLRRLLRGDHDPLTASDDDNSDGDSDFLERVTAEDAANGVTEDAPWFVDHLEPLPAAEEPCLTARFGDKECLMQRNIVL